MNRTIHRDDAGARLGMWLFLFTEILLFGGLFILYSVYRSRFPHDFANGGSQLNLLFGTANTVILITSSMLAAMAVTAVQKGNRRYAQLFLGGTILCALIFMVDKYLEWSVKIHHGIFPSSPTVASGPPGESVFFSLYYLTTGIHGFHVCIGVAVLAWVMSRINRGVIHSGDYVVLENSTLYWHLVDLVWIFIFPLYYLIL